MESNSEDRFVRFGIPLCVGLLLALGGTAAIASDDNPWRMESPAESRQYVRPGDVVRSPDTPVWGMQGDRQTEQPYFDLNRNGLQKRDGYRQPQQSPAYAGDAAGGRTVQGIWPAQPEGGRRAVPAPGQRPDTPPAERRVFDGGRLTEDYGYAGPDRDYGAGDGRGLTAPQYGDFPPLEGSNRRNGGGTGAGVEFGGQYYGAFPPLERKPAGQDRRQRWDQTGVTTESGRERTSEFANVPPPPVPDPVPDEAYPHAGYGVTPGYGAGRYGLPYDPLTMGIFGPGLLW